MNRLNRRYAAIALLFGIVLLVSSVLDAAAGINSFTLHSGPTYSAQNYVWIGEATLSNPQKYMCISFPDADPAVGPVYCPWTGGDAFSCMVPLSHFNNNLGQDLTWQFFAGPNTNCNGSTINATGPGSSGSVTPTAVSLTSLGAGILPDMTWIFALAALALLSGVVVISRRRLAS